MSTIFPLSTFKCNYCYHYLLEFCQLPYIILYNLIPIVREVQTRLLYVFVELLLLFTHILILMLTNYNTTYDLTHLPIIP